MFSTIDIKDLRQVKANELQPNGYFYKKNPDGSFSMCNFSDYELSDIHLKNYITEISKQLAEKGLLYVRLNKPFHNFINKNL